MLWIVILWLLQITWIIRVDTCIDAHVLLFFILAMDLMVIDHLWLHLLRHLWLLVLGGTDSHTLGVFRILHHHIIIWWLNLLLRRADPHSLGTSLKLVIWHERWLAYVYCRRVIWVEICKLLLETCTLDILVQLCLPSWSTLTLPDFSKGVSEAFNKLPAAALHKPNFEICIRWKGVKERFASAWEVICPKNRLIKFLLK